MFNEYVFSDFEKQLFVIIADEAKKLNYPSYIVGGYVRDKLLLRDNKKDIDFVCIGSGIELALNVAKKLGKNIHVSVFKNFGTAHFKYNGIDLEFVGARKESYNRDSRKPVVENGTLEDDQNRRDFTMNALAISLNENNYGEIIDPFHGISDIENKIIRTPLDPVITFSDDPLRMMRAIRFATELHFIIEEKTFNGIKESAERINIISPERITDELNKIILSDIPSKGFYLLHESGLLKYIFPEMIDLVGVEMQDGRGHKDNFYHTLEVLDNISLNTNDLWLRWAAVLHDIAKPATKRYFEKQGWAFHGHEVVGSRMVKGIFKRMRLPLDAKMKFVEKMVLLHLRPISLTKENVTDSAIRRLLFDAGEDIESLMLLCKADITTKNRLKVKRYSDNFEMVRQKLKDVEEHDKIQNFQPPVSGELIMKTFNVNPGRKVGLIKDHIKEAILDGIIPNEYEAAYQLMLKKGAELGLTPQHK
ncbi:MAG: HD domain-containing protein [Fimbriimonadaceae bacterium]|nr:HD domain-containing protein [Chitinophagales bacterium]